MFKKCQVFGLHIIGGMNKTVKRPALFRQSPFADAGGERFHFLVASIGRDAYYRAVSKRFSDSAPALSGLLLWQEPGGACPERQRRYGVFSKKYRRTKV